ncbi:hypothetical protein ACFC96_27595 [Streptomyces sp. NPDC055955]|uniref:hypothetical protein n=1 Tax=Streptomyces sp. NPDC055955 TaxID=3345665 RepID=UPI0035E15836
MWAPRRRAAITRQHREHALVRAVGARPRQVRRTAAQQALAASVPAVLAGFFPASGLLGQVRSRAAGEAVLTAGTALLLGALIALATLAPVLATAFGPPPPYVPWPPAPGPRTVASPLLPMLLATGVPVRSVTRHRAITVVRA